MVPWSGGSLASLEDAAHEGEQTGKGRPRWGEEYLCQEWGYWRTRRSHPQEPHMELWGGGL